MGRKLIFITGVGIGYVLGTRAGRERFDQMVVQARKFWESPTVQEAAGVVQAQATRLYDDGKQAVTEQVHRLRDKTDHDLPEGTTTAEDMDTASRRSQFPANAF